MQPRAPLQAHIFVCQNQRDADHPRGCCQARGGEALLKALKTEISRRGLGKSVRAQRAGCLDVCENGAALVVYPQNVWYGQVELSDVAELVESQLIQNKPLLRRQIPLR